MKANQLKPKSNTFNQNYTKIN